MFDRTLTEFLVVGVSSFVLTAILSHFIIPILVAKKAGQPIRAEGPKSHFSKAGTPTMGGIAFLIASSLSLGIAAAFLFSRGERAYGLSLLLALGFFGVLICAAPGVGDVGSNIVGLLKHPVVAPGDGVMWVDGFDSLREHSVGVVVVFRLLARHIGQYNCVVDLWIFLL